MQNILFALLAAAGIFLMFSALAFPRRVKLEKPQGGLMKRLQARLDAAELPVTAREFLTACLLVAVAGAGLAVVLGAPALAVAGVTIGPALLWQRYESQRDAFRQAYDEALAEVTQLMREGFSATGSMRDALDHAARNGPDPAAADLRDVWRAQQVGTDLEEAFAAVMERRRNPFLRMIAEALTLKATEGGSIGEVLLGLETMVREQVALRREIAAKQAQARLESLIVSLAPIGFFLVMKVLPWMREYEAGFYSSLEGQIVLTVALVFAGTAFFMARRMATRGLTLEVKDVV
ncbi:MAG TPA: type II secretion system F family protein [Anaerolineae bacterium]|nr:type II secretion system F family protein [Anaerolineae bacterium]